MKPWLMMVVMYLFPVSLMAEPGWVLEFESETQKYREQLGEKPEILGPASKGNSRVFITATAARAEETSFNNPKDPNLSWMFRKGNGQPTLVWPNRKTYSEQPGDPMTDEDYKKNAKGPFQPIGKTKTVAGYECIVMTRKHDPGFKTEVTQNWGTEEVCIASILAPVFDLDAKFGWTVSAPVSPWNLPKATKGIPVETISRTASGFVSSRTRLRSAKQQDIDDSLFQIPKGYKKMEFDLGKAFAEALTGKGPAKKTK